MICLPFLGLESEVLEMGGFSMTIYGRSVRGLACGLFDRGLGHEATAARFGRPLGSSPESFFNFWAVHPTNVK